MSTESLESKTSNESDVTKQLALYAPASAGHYDTRAQLTMQCAQEIFPSLLRLVDKPLTVLTPNEFCLQVCPSTSDISKPLRELFDAYGSDKHFSHCYEQIYGRLFDDPSSVTHVLEIGIGSQNTDIVSHMPTITKPGASLRAFRDVFPNATIYGADIDRQVLFQEPRIDASYYVDQTQLDSLVALNENLPKCDLIIDDGLHCAFANINVVSTMLTKLKPNGYLIIEDIPTQTLPVWQLIARLLPHPCYIVLF